MSDNDLIRRGDAVLAVTAADKECLGANGAREFIRVLPAAPTFTAADLAPHMTKPPELKPCPFCSGTKVYVRTIMQEADIFCPECETNGPVHNSEAEAVAAWNTRTSDPAVQALVEAANDAVLVLEEADCQGSQVMADLLAALRAIGGE